MSTPLAINRRDGVTELTLARPDKANALTAELVEALIDAVAGATRDGTRLLVLRGEGKTFCAGFDFAELDAQSDGDLALRFIRIELMLQAIHHAPIATLALCHGAAYGAGADIVCACDRRVAAPGAKFRMPGLRFGIALGTRRLAACIGTDAAIDLLSESRAFDADKALRLGLITTVAPQTAWDEVVQRARDGETLEPAAKARLKACATPDRRAADLAMLAESVSVPGLKARMAAFRAAPA